MIIRRNMVRLLCVTSLSVALIFTTGAFAFAVDIPDATEETADVVQNFIDTGETGNVVENAEAFVDDSGDVTTTIPKDGNAFVTMKDEEGVEIGMSLPEELDTEEGIATDSGTVVYQSDDSADVCVQSITDEQDGITIDGVRELVVIKSKDAPKEYTFHFDLPEGYSLVASEEYCARKNKAIDTEEEKMEVEPGFVYVVNGEDEIQAVLDAPWAKDANGNDVATNYTIDGTTLTQHVAFDENSSFPIVADPASHPNKKRTIYLSKKQCIKWRNKSENGFGGACVETAASIIVGCANTPAGVLMTVFFLSADQYRNVKHYKTWVHIVDKFKGKYARIKLEMKWRGKNAGYVYSGKILEVAYVK